jgi:CBS domain containing-hemolysin-like protein
MELLLFFFLVSIFFSFLCSIWEAVLLSIPPSFVAASEKKGNRSGLLLAHFKSNIDRPLAAILTLNTIAHTVGAIGVGAQAAHIWSDVDLFGVNVAAVLVPSVMTLAILILSEIIPKTLGANYWRSLAGITAASVNVIIYGLYPLVWISQKITQALKKQKHKSVLSRAEFSAMAEIVAREGILKKHEYAIIENLMRFEMVRAEDIMTPRTVVVAVQQDITAGDFYRRHGGVRFSRIPLFEKNIDHISGFVLRQDILSHIIDDRPDIPLKEMQRDISMVAEDIPLPAVFNTLMTRRQHIAVVVDQYGTLTGIVTLEDILETLLGLEIVDESDHIEDMQKLARKLWKQRARQSGLI